MKRDKFVIYLRDHGAEHLLAHILVLQIEFQALKRLFLRANPDTDTAEWERILSEERRKLVERIESLKEQKVEQGGLKWSDIEPFL